MSPWLLVLIRLLVVRAPQDADVTTRAYDVRDLVWVSGPTALEFDLCRVRPSGGLDERPEVAVEPPVDIERVRETLQEIAAQRWPEDVVRVTAAEPRLFVTAPDHLQDDLAQLLTWMRAACSTDERLQVRVLVGEGVLDLPMFLDLADADRRVADLVATKRAQVVRTAATTLRDGLAVTLRALDTRLYTRDYDVEIAGNSVVYDPVIDTATHGLEATVRAVRTHGGTYLDLAMRHASADQWRERVLEPQAWSPKMNGSSASTARPATAGAAIQPIMRERMPIRLDLPLDRFVSWAGSLVLPDGKVLYVPCQVTAHTGVAAAAFEVRVDGAHRALRTSLPRAATDAFEVAILQTGALGALGFDQARVGPAAFVNAMPTENDTGSAFWPSFVRAAPLDARPLANDIIATEAPDDAEAYHKDLSPFHLVLRAPAETCERVAGKIASRLDALRTFEVSGRVVSGERELARFRVPVVAGRLTTIWSGLAGSFLFDWDVDVANNAAIAHPQLGWLLDGLALQLMVQPLTAPRLEVAVNGKLHFLAGPPALTSLESPFSPVCEKIKTQALFLDETMLVRARDASDGVRFGDAHLALEIRVAESASIAPVR